MLATLLRENGMDAPTRKCRDGTLPKIVGRNIGLHHADLPWARKPLPYLVCYLSSDSTPPASAKDEEFSHIPDSQVGGDFRPALHQNEPCQVATLLYKKRKSARFAPIKWKQGIAEPASTIHLQTVEFAEIVRVQLQEIRERRLLFRGGWDHFDIRGQPLRRLGHSSGRNLHSQYVTAQWRAARGILRAVRRVPSRLCPGSFLPGFLAAKLPRVCSKDCKNAAIAD